MAGFVAAAVVGGAVIGGIASSRAASSQARAASEAAETQSAAAVRVAEIETEAAQRAADLQAEAFRQAAAEQERGILAAGGIQSGTPQTVEDLYASILQRDADPTGLDFYRDRFGPTIEPQEIIEFRAAAAPELTRRATDPQGYAQDLARQGLRGNLPAPGIVGAGEVQARASEQAAQQQAAAQLEAARLQREQAERAFQAQQSLLSPFRAAGVNALGRIEAGLAPGGEFAQPFTTERFQADPGYAFRLSEGQKALERQSAARGGLMSGGALRAATRFGQEMGSQEFQNAFNRYYAEREAQLNPLFNLSGGGLAASSSLAGMAGTLGANVANYLGAGETGAAASRAQGILGAGAARSSSYLEDLQARAQAQRDLATTRASAYTGPAQFQAQGLLRAGQATAGGLQGAATATSQGLLQAGQARAAGQLGVANALTGALNTGVNLYSQNQILNRLYGTGGGGVNMPTNAMQGGFTTFSPYG